MSFALTEKRYEERIIPVLFKKCKIESLSWVLPQLQIIDFTKGFTHGCHELLRIWNKRFFTKTTDAIEFKSKLAAGRAAPLEVVHDVTPQT